MTTAAEPPWQITPEKVQMVVQRLIEVASPKKIILFGSYVRGDATRDSDLDVLVVTSHEVESPRRESVRLRNSLSDINMNGHRGCTFYPISNASPEARPHLSRGGPPRQVVCEN